MSKSWYQFSAKCNNKSILTEHNEYHEFYLNHVFNKLIWRHWNSFKMTFIPLPMYYFTCNCTLLVTSIPIYYQIKLFSITNNSQLSPFIVLLTWFSIFVTIRHSICDSFIFWRIDIKFLFDILYAKSLHKKKSYVLCVYSVDDIEYQIATNKVVSMFIINTESVLLTNNLRKRSYFLLYIFISVANLKSDS